MKDDHPPVIMETSAEDEDDEDKTFSDFEDDDEDGEDDRYLALLQFQRICARNQELQRLYGGSESMEDSGMLWSAARGMGSVLKIFTPIALLSIFFTHDSFIFKIFNHCDRTIRSVFFPPPVKRTDILKWLQSRLPGDKRCKSLDAVWSDGTVLCDLVESVVPGSCIGHVGEARVDLQHGQRLAEQYLGVQPIFSPDELSSTLLSTYQECRLTHYLNSVKEAIIRLSPPISRAGSPFLNFQAFTLDYVARGMGLVSAFKNKKAAFFLYPTAQQSLEPGDISVQIRGPGNCYGAILVPVIYGRAHIIRNMFLSNIDRQSYPTIPIQQEYPTSNVDKNYLNSKVKNDIEVNIIIKHDRVKVTYIPITTGPHELSLISKGCHLMGSPFMVNIELAQAGRTDSADCFEDDAVPIEQPKTDRKIVFRIVDFVTEKMILTEDGTLQKISNEQAESLINAMKSYEENLHEDAPETPEPISLTLQSPDLIENNNNVVVEKEENHQLEHFDSIVNRVILMMKVCKNFASTKIFNKAADDKIREDINDNFITTPDIVNSTLSDSEAKRKSAASLRANFKNKLSQSFNSISESPKFRPPPVEIIISSIDEDDNVKSIPYVGSPCPTPIFEVPFERPKTPVLKILEDGDDEPYRPESPAISFHIGEPVSPKNIPTTAKCSEDVESIILASNLEEALNKFDQKLQNSESEANTPSIFSTPMRYTPFEQMTDSEILEMYENDHDSDRDEDDMHEFNIEKGGVNIVNNKQNSFSSDDNQGNNSDQNTRSNSIEQNWDSAYVSIDDNINSGESRSNSSRSSNSSKNKLFCIEEIENEIVPNKNDYKNMGPAEKEIWNGMNENKKSNPFLETNFDEPIGSSSLHKSISDNAYGKSEEIDGSASDFKADVNQSTLDENKKAHMAKTITEKKNYWDEKIRKSFEANDEEKNFSKKKSSVLRRNDSLSKKRNKQASVKSTNMVDKWKQSFVINDDEEIKPNGSLVSKWKNYWDEKIEKSLSPEPDERSNKIVQITEEIKNYSGSFLELNGEQENYPVSTFSNEVFASSYKYEPRPLNLKKLSDRIDEYLVSASPVQESVASTPDNFSTCPTPLIENIKISNKNIGKIITDDEENVHSTEDELSEIKQFSNVKEKIQLIRSASHQSAKEMFLANKSQSIDLPKSENFHKLRRYFSIDVIDSSDLRKSSLQTTFKSFNTENMNSSRSLSGIELEKNSRNSASNESLESISARKVRLENHLKDIQIRRQKQNVIEEKPKITILEAKDCKADAKYEVIDSSERIALEVTSVVKPIKALVAAFENVSRSKSEENISKSKPKISINGGNVFGCVTDIKNVAETPEGTTVKNLTSSSAPHPSCTPQDDDEDMIKSDGYKKQFRKAKEFFQTMGQSKPTKETVRARPLNECEILLLEKMHKAKPIENGAPVRPKRTKKLVLVKASSAPSSDTESEMRRMSWHGHKLFKISEKFLVEDLFKDIAGESTRTAAGTFKGIPHKDAVLAAFKSMDNVTQPSSYEYSVAQMEDFARTNGVVNSQTYHSDFPHLPTTEPSKYRSRFDAAASGLIFRRDLLKLRKLRRNSAPDETTSFSSHMITNV